MADTKTLIEIPAFITVRELATMMGVSPINVIKELMANGIMANINQQIDFDTAAIVAGELGFDVVAHVFEHPYVEGVRVLAEIEQLEWVHPSEARDDMAPLNIVHVFPALLASTRPFQ